VHEECTRMHARPLMGGCYDKLCFMYVHMFAIYISDSQLVGRGPVFSGSRAFAWAKKKVTKKIPCFYFEGDFLFSGVPSIPTP